MRIKITNTSDMAERLRRISDSEKKRKKAAWAKETRARLVNIRDHIDTWNTIKEKENLQHDGEVAGLLIESYRQHQQFKEDLRRKRRRVTSTPALGDTISDPPSEISSVGAASNGASPLLMSGVENIESSTSESEIRVQHGPPAHDRPHQAPTISFEDVSALDAGELRDEHDDTYVPSEWNISIAVPEPQDAEIDDLDVTDMVHDISEPDEEESEAYQAEAVMTNVRDENLQDPLYLVTQSQLLQLARLLPYTACMNCNKPLEISEKKNGSAVTLNWVCEAGHVTHVWTSQPVLRHGAMLGNIKLLAAILLSGNNYTKVALMCKFAGMGIPSKASFFRLQNHYFVPAISDFWMDVKDTVQQERKSSHIVVSGDGRMDSPGHCAKFCTYTVMSQDKKQILAMEVVDKRECELVSNRMEAVGFQHALVDIQQSGIIVDEVVTDAHTQIASIMKKKYPLIKHSWDMWHGAKNLGKKLCAASQEKGKSALKPWISPITNHFFYAAEKCNKDEMKLKTTLLTVVNHVVNRHEWALGGCEHGELEEDRDKEWLVPDGPEVRSLNAILLDARFQRGLTYYVTCQSTSELESFHNHMLMYVSKRMAFGYAVYKCRCQLAALDYMKHLDRPYKKNKKGEQCYTRAFSKAANHWSVVPTKVKKTYEYIGPLMLDIVQRYHTGDERMRHKAKRVAGDPVTIAPTIAPIPPPPTKILVQQQKARLQIWGPSTGADVGPDSA